MHHNTRRKIVIAGGSGFLGTLLAKHLGNNYQVVVLSRNTKPEHNSIRTVQWNARDVDDWTHELEGAYAIINLTGKNVNCRYTPANKREILESRLLSTKVLGEAFATLKDPPKVWLQSSSATIYRHAKDKPMDETFGETGSDFSIDVCKDWEQAFSELDLNGTRKIIMRTSIVMGHGGGALPSLKNIVKFGLGGRQGDGRQMMSWIHEEDIISVVDWMLDGNATGVYNVTSPQPVTNEVFMKYLRRSCRIPIGLPTPEWLLTFGATLIGTEPELVLKSRWVIPKRLIQEGYRFKFPSAESAIKDLMK